MAITIGNLRRNRSGNTGGGSETIAIEFKAVEVADPKQSNPEKDVLVGYLLHPMRGVEYRTEDVHVEGESYAYLRPITEVRVKMRTDRPQTAVKGDNEPLTIYDLPRKKNLHQPMKPGGTVIVERAYLDERTGIIMGGWITAAVRDPEEGLATAHPGRLVSVSPVRENDAGHVRQERTLVLTEDATVFDSSQKFREIAAGMLAMPAPESGGGTPGAIVRVVSLDDPSKPAYASFRRRWNPDANPAGFATPDESIDAFLNYPDNAGWAEQIRELDAATAEERSRFIFELIPIQIYRTGTKSLPSATRGRDDSKMFDFVATGEDGEVIHRRDNSVLRRPGFAVGTQIVLRQATDEDAVWFATRTFRQDRYGPIFTWEEIPTDNLPAEVRKLYDVRAAERTAFTRKFDTESRAKHEDSVEFGDPLQEADPAAGRSGLTPR